MDEERILSKIDSMDQYLKEIEDDMPSNLNEYQDNKRKYERLLHLSIEAVIDVCSLILKNEGLGAPNDEESILDKLADNKIINQDIAKNVKDMKAFRNVLVHRYGEVDDRKVYEKLEKLEDFKEFRKRVIEYLEK